MKMFELPLHFIYPIYTAILAIIMFAVVPREDIKALSIYALMFGAIANIVLIIVAGNLLKWGGHINYGPFGMFGVSFFPPIAWTAFFIMYLYILPHQKPWYYLFTISSAIYSTFFANVLIKLGIFETNIGNLIIPFFIYLSWHSLVTWLYLSYFRKKSVYID